MTVPVGKFVRHVAIDTPGAPNPTIEDAIVSAAIDFCELSSVWQENVPDLYLLPGIRTYALSVPDGARVHRFVTAQNHLGEDVQETTTGWLNLNVPGWEKQRGDAVEYITFEQSVNVIGVSPVPDRSHFRGLTGMRVILKPLRDSTELPAFLYEDHLEAIAHKAKDILLRMPGKAWSNVSAANEYLTLYAGSIKPAAQTATPGLTGRQTTYGMRRNTYT